MTVRNKVHPLEKNELLQALESAPAFSPAVLDQAHRKMAFAIAALEHELNSQQPDHDRAKIASRLADASKNFAKSALIQRQQMMEEHLNLKSPKIMFLFDHWMEKVMESFRGLSFGLDAEDLFCRLLSENLEGWEEEMEKRFKRMEAAQNLPGAKGSMELLQIPD